MAHSLKIEYDDSILSNIGMSEDKFNEEARLILAAKLFEQRRLSSGQAAKLAGIERVEFLYSLPRLGVSMSNLSSEDLGSELEFLNNA